MYYYIADNTLSLLWLIIAVWYRPRKRVNEMYQNSLPFWCEYKKLYKMIYKISGFSIEPCLKIMRIMFTSITLHVNFSNT